MEDITDADYIHEKKEWKNFRIKNLGGYHEFGVIHHYLLMQLKTLEINVLKKVSTFLLVFISTWIRIAYMFKKPGVELELLTDNNMLLIAEKGMKEGICHAIHR